VRSQWQDGTHSKNELNRTILPIGEVAGETVKKRQKSQPSVELARKTAIEGNNAPIRSRE